MNTPKERYINFLRVLQYHILIEDRDKLVEQLTERLTDDEYWEITERLENIQKEITYYKNTYDF